MMTGKFKVHSKQAAFYLNTKSSFAGPPETQALENVKAGQVALSKLARKMSQDKELLQASHAANWFFISQTTVRSLDGLFIKAKLW